MPENETNEKSALAICKEILRWPDSGQVMCTEFTAKNLKAVAREFIEMNTGPDTRWVPTAERLPSSAGLYLLLMAPKCNRQYEVMDYDVLITLPLSFWNKNVIAWMPIPPYQDAET